MTSDGRQLEALVAFVEKTLLPQGFAVSTNERVFNDDGVQIAEFDVEIRGRVGSTNIAWLIECRDRPADGPAPGSWIEQLVGRRVRFGFNKITAVSTTGFTHGATEFAQAQGIELREVEALRPEAFTDWLAIGHFQHLEKLTTLQHASILVRPDEADDRKQALLDLISKTSADAAFLRSTKTGAYVAPAKAFLGAVEALGTLFDDLLPNGPPKKVRLQANYADDDDHFVVDTSLGPVRVQAILFKGVLSLKETLVPLSVTAQYQHADSGRPISQVAAFAPVGIHGMTFAIEMHRMAESGETHVILRRVRDDA